MSGIIIVLALILYSLPYDAFPLAFLIYHNAPFSQMPTLRSWAKSINGLASPIHPLPLEGGSHRI